ncbi:hypothetical protein [Desulfobacter sp.]|uniref:hypothetical protein n=1 Tax=Desulfobacter sp. TaxID=2294 RepID=UPI003D103DAF
MDFGDIITLILFLVFIVSPFLNRKKTNKAGKPAKSKQSGFSVLGKLKEVLKEAAREMEAQAEQARKKEAAGQSNRPLEPQSSSGGQTGEKYVNQTLKKGPRRKAAKIPETRGSRSLTQKSFGHDAMQTSCLRSGSRRLPARSRGLQKAVIWKEILGKPVALRD